MRLNELVGKRFVFKGDTSFNIYKVEVMNFDKDTPLYHITANDQYFACIDHEFKDILVWYRYIFGEKHMGIIEESSIQVIEEGLRNAA